MLIANFYEDYVSLVRAMLQQRGYAMSSSASNQDVVFSFFNLFRRLIEPRPRAVHVAPTLICPAELEAGFVDVKKKISDGTDLRPHLSTGLAKLDYNDSLLNDWGLHHLHLGTKPIKNGFVQRTGPLLFARFEPDDAYLLAVAAHGAWTNADFIDCLHTYWPDVVRRWRAPNLSSRITEAQRKMLRANHGNATVAARDGTVYLPPGGGMMTSGLALEVLTIADRTRKTLEDWEAAVLKSERDIRAQAAMAGITAPDPWTFRLALEAGRGAAVALEGQRKVHEVALGFLP